MPAKVVLHIPPQTYAGVDLSAPHLALHARIRRLIASRGGEVEVRLSDTRLRRLGGWDGSVDDLLEDEALHILENGTVRRGNVLNTSLAYLPGFFELDPEGVLAFSSLRHSAYEADHVPRKEAEQLFAALHAAHVVPRRSRYTQTEAPTEIPKGAIAVFLQGRNPQRQGSTYCNTETMLRAVAAGASGRPVLVKAHPRSRIEREAELLFRLNAEGLSLIPTEANVHDILEKSAVSVSYNSAVAVEGFLHGTPAILFGQSDFHHVCETVRDPDDFAAALARAVGSEHDYASYLYWFLTQMNLPLDDPALDARLLARFAQVGFGEARLGLVEPRGDRAAMVRAAEVLARDVSALPRVESCKVLTPLKLTERAWVFVVRINGQKGVIKRVFDADPVGTINGMKTEMSRATADLADGPHRIAACLNTWPEAGMILMDFAQGPRLGDKIAAATGQSRVKLMTQASAWLAAYHADRQRQTTFAPRFWIRRLLAMETGQLENVRDLQLLEALIENLRGQVKPLVGVDVLQAATHPRFDGAHAHYHQGTITGVGLGSEAWQAVARVAARFLVEQRLRDPDRPAETMHGIGQSDWDAFLQGGALPEAEADTTLPFFVGEQLYLSLVRGRHRQAARAAIVDYLDLFG